MRKLSVKILVGLMAGIVSFGAFAEGAKGISYNEGDSKDLQRAQFKAQYFMLVDENGKPMMDGDGKPMVMTMDEKGHNMMMVMVDKEGKPMVDNKGKPMVMKGKKH